MMIKDAQRWLIILSLGLSFFFLCSKLIVGSFQEGRCGKDGYRENSSLLEYLSSIVHNREIGDNRQCAALITADCRHVNADTNIGLLYGSYEPSNNFPCCIQNDSFHFFHFLEFALAAFIELYDAHIDNSKVQWIFIPQFHPHHLSGGPQSPNFHIAKMIWPNARWYSGGSRGVASKINLQTKMISTVEAVMHIDRGGCDHGGVNKMLAKFVSRFDANVWHRALWGRNHHIKKKHLDILLISRQGKGTSGRASLPDHDFRFLVELLSNITYVNLHSAQLETLSYNEQARLAHDADVLVGTHGNGLSHILNMRPKRFVFEFSRHDFHFDYQVFARMMGHQYAFVYGGSDRITSPQQFYFRATSQLSAAGLRREPGINEASTQGRTSPLSTAAIQELLGMIEQAKIELLLPHLGD